MTSENPKNTTKTKINSSSKLFFHELFFKKILNMNFSHQTEPFDTNIIRFDGLNQYQ